MLMMPGHGMLLVHVALYTTRIMRIEVLSIRISSSYMEWGQSYSSQVLSYNN